MITRCCCGGGSQQEGNSECVPLCAGTNVYNFTIALSHEGWSRGTPGTESDFEQPASCAPGCCGGRYKEVRKRENVVGKYTGRAHADGLFPSSDLCECCKIDSVDIVTPGGSWSADFVYTYATNTMVRNNYVEDFNYTNSLTAKFWTCVLHPSNDYFDCQCAGPAGLFDVLEINAGGINLVDFDYNAGAGNCGLDGTSTYFSNHNVRLFYVKPVPFATCRTLAGTYRLACARYIVPYTPWVYWGAFGATELLCSYRKFVNTGGSCWIEELGDCFANDPIYSCGPDAGFNVPKTVVVT